MVVTSTAHVNRDGCEGERNVAKLLSLKRSSDGTLTVKWEYRNKTDQPKRLGEPFDAIGSSEPFSPVWYAYLVEAKGED